MILPIKLYTTEDSFLIFGVTIPIWFSIREGFKPDQISTDRPFAPRITLMTGDMKNCLHAYCLCGRFRIRSNKIMKALKEGTPRFVFSFHKGWGQVFDSAII